MNARPVVATFAVSAGAALGALSRWVLGLCLDALAPSLAFGTLTANLVGGYLIGIAVGFFDRRADLPPAWRLFAITGFLGGLTTFSTFSAEVTRHLQEGRLAAACVEIAVHVVGSVALTLLGIATMRWMQVPPPVDEAGEALDRLAGE